MYDSNRSSAYEKLKRQITKNKMIDESKNGSNYNSYQTNDLSSGSEGEDDPTKMRISVTDVIMTFRKKEKKML